MLLAAQGDANAKQPQEERWNEPVEPFQGHGGKRCLFHNLSSGAPSVHMIHTLRPDIHKQDLLWAFLNPRNQAQASEYFEQSLHLPGCKEATTASIADDNFLITKTWQLLLWSRNAVCMMPLDVSRNVAGRGCMCTPAV